MFRMNLIKQKRPKEQRSSCRYCERNNLWYIELNNLKCEPKLINELCHGGRDTKNQTIETQGDCTP